MRFAATTESSIDVPLKSFRASWLRKLSGLEQFCFRWCGSFDEYWGGHYCLHECVNESFIHQHNFPWFSCKTARYSLKRTLPKYWRSSWRPPNLVFLDDWFPHYSSVLAWTWLKPVFISNSTSLVYESRGHGGFVKGHGDPFKADRADIGWWNRNYWTKTVRDFIKILKKDKNGFLISQPAVSRKWL